jgi:hypothetical protein
MTSLNGARGSCHIAYFFINGVDNSITRVRCLHFPGLRVFIKVHVFIKRNGSLLRVQGTERAREMLRNMGTKDCSRVSWTVINVCERQTSSLQLPQGDESSRSCSEGHTSLDECVVSFQIIHQLITFYLLVIKKFVWNMFNMTTIKHLRLLRSPDCHIRCNALISHITWIRQNRTCHFNC